VEKYLSRKGDGGIHDAFMRKYYLDYKQRIEGLKTKGLPKHYCSSH
jgi:hypothetical protein